MKKNFLRFILYVGVLFLAVLLLPVLDRPLGRLRDSRATAAP